MNLLSWRQGWFLCELHSSPSFKVRDGIHCAVWMSQLGWRCQNNFEVLKTVFLLLIQTNNNKYQFPSQVLPPTSKQGVKDWNVNLNLLCNQERCFDFSWSSSCRFCSEGRKHSIVNGQSFRLPIEQRAVKLERRKVPKKLSEMFHTTILRRKNVENCWLSYGDITQSQTFVSPIGLNTTQQL